MALKLNDAQMIFRLLAVMLFAMASLELPKPGSRTQYTKCMFLSLSFLLFHRRKKNAIWQLFLSDPGIFNEEICESALSQLARAITSRPNLRVLEAANKRLNAWVCFQLLVPVYVTKQDWVSPR